MITPKSHKIPNVYSFSIKTIKWYSYFVNRTFKVNTWIHIVHIIQYTCDILAGILKEVTSPTSFVMFSLLQT